ncbi:MAG: nucleotide exchange factor GrpE [Clostridia bacterium]|nr:nucleotide exchange factor GrpE [Clostridia bacterium]
MEKEKKQKKSAQEEVEETVEETVETEQEEANPLEELEEKIAALQDKNLRLMAEFENYKKRTQKEKEQSYEFAMADTVGKLLPVLDTLELSLTQNATDGNAFKAGIELVVKQFRTTLEKIGVTEIPALNEPFNPELHNAVMRAEDGDGEPDTVVEVLQKGYTLKERVIRHSMVKVKA